MEPGIGPPSDAPAQELIEAGFQLEIADAPYLHKALNLADMAHVLVLSEQGIVPHQPARRLLTQLLEVHRHVPFEDFPYDATLGDVYNSREQFFVSRLGDDAGWLHAGRPRREAGRISLRLCLRGLLGELVQDATHFVDVVCNSADTHADVVMPDQTYLQQAQPSTFGHYILAFTYPTMRDAERLLTEQKLLNRSPGGAGCVNGSRLKIDRDRTAELLGFDDVITHTRDAMWQTDGLVAILADIASLVGNFSKVAEDLEIWDSSEFDFVQLGGPYTRASVLMPQKRNPYSLAIVRGASGILVGRLSGFLAVIKTPSARSDNLIFAYGEVPRAVELAGRITRLMSGVIGSLELHPDRMWQSLLAGFSQATDLAEYVMQACNVDYRSAYHIVGTAVRRAAQAGMRGVDVTGEMLDEAALEQVGHPLGLSGQDLRELLDPRKIALERNSTGGAAPQVVRRMAASARREAEGIRRAAARRAAAYEAAEAALVSRAEALTRG